MSGNKGKLPIPSDMDPETLIGMPYGASAAKKRTYFTKEKNAEEQVIMQAAQQHILEDLTKERANKVITKSAAGTAKTATGRFKPTANRKVAHTPKPKPELSAQQVFEAFRSVKGVPYDEFRVDTNDIAIKPDNMEKEGISAQQMHQAFASIQGIPYGADRKAPKPAIDEPYDPNGPQPSDPSEVAKRRPLRFLTNSDSEGETMKKYLKPKKATAEDTFDNIIAAASAQALANLDASASTAEKQQTSVLARRRAAGKVVLDLARKKDEDNKADKKAKASAETVKKAVNMAIKIEEGLTQSEGKPTLLRCLKNHDDNGRFARAYLRMGLLKGKERRKWLTEKFEDFFWLHQKKDINSMFIKDYGSGPVKKKEKLVGIELGSDEDDDTDEEDEADDGPVEAEDSAFKDEDDIPIPIKGAVRKLRGTPTPKPKWSATVVDKACGATPGSSSSGEGMALKNSSPQKK